MFPAIQVIIKLTQSIWKMMTHAGYRSLLWWMLRYATLSRFITFYPILPGGTRFEAIDITSFIAMFRAIFIQEVYKFHAVNKASIILDCGANIGLSVLYFKQLCPTSTIHAFEADPQIFQVLKRNVKAANLKKVVLHQEAVWTKKCLLTFESDHADGGHVSSASVSKVSETRVQAVNFAQVLKQFKHIDFLKMDIEGAETEVLLHVMPLLHRVDHIFFEYHGFRHDVQRLGELLTKLHALGFRYHVMSEHGVLHPFVDMVKVGSMDMQLDIFVWKNETGQRKKR